MATKRILSIDGGGIRGIIPGKVLIALEEQIQKETSDPDARISDHFDLIAGTSTGGILACCLITPDKNGRPKFTAKEAVDIYLERGDEIFDVSVWKTLTSLGGNADEKYSADELEDALHDYLDDIELKDLLKPSLITAYNIRRRETHFFKQHKAEDPANNFYVRDVCRATSAAPTYFEVAKIKSFSNVSYPLIDGGVFANNPSMCAYAEARTEFGVGAKDMNIVSLGTGHREKPYSYTEAKDWGPLGWAKPVLDIMMSGVAETIDYQLIQIFDSVKKKDQYHRIQTELPTWVSSDMDNAEPENIRKLEEVGESLAGSSRDQISKIVKQLIDEN